MYAAAAMVAQSFTVNLTSQTITFANPGAQTVGTPLTLKATASSGLTVSFTSTTASVCTVSGSTATFLAAGTCTIDANQAGNSVYAAAAMVAQSFTVNLTSQTITFANPGAQTVGTSLTLKATASSGLPVSFTSTTASVCTVSGTTTTFITAGTCTIDANQAGNSVYAAAAMVAQSFTVNLTSQTITFANPGAQSVGKPLTLAATASSGLPVSFTSTTASVCTVSGSTATFLAAGTCTIDANQAGNSTYAAATMVAQSFTVYTTSSNVITFAQPPAQVVGTPLNLVATASSGLPVSFATTTPATCTVFNSAVQFLQQGTCTITASQSGNGSTIPAATPVSRNVSVSGAANLPQTITMTAELPAYTNTQMVTNFSSSSGLPVNAVSLTQTICGGYGGWRYTELGTCTIQATVAGNANYAPATQTFNITVIGELQSIDFANPGPQKVGTPLTLAATASSGFAVAFSSTTSSVCTVSGLTATFLTAGTCTIQATQAGGFDPNSGNNYQAAPMVAQSFPVYSATQLITFNPPAGTYSSAKSVTISDSVTGSPLYYTTDGSTPTTASTVYSAPISVSTTETLSVYAAATTTAAPATASATYTISAGNIAVSISPTSASLNASAKQSFTATVTGTTGSQSTSVNWSATCGSFSSATSASGVAVTYTAPAVAGNCTLFATSVADSTKIAQTVVSIAVPGTVNVFITPAVAYMQSGGSKQFTATVTGSSNTAVTWTISCYGISSCPANIMTVNGNTATVTDKNLGTDGVTATSVADPTVSATATVTIIPAGVTYPPVPFPIAAHPRLLLTPADVTLLQKRATSSNPVYEQGWVVLVQDAQSDYNTQFFPGGQPNPNWPDSGGVNTGSSTAGDALVFAFDSLINPNQAARIDDAQKARNLTMYVMNLVAQGDQPGAPFRDPKYNIGDTGRWSGADWPLIVDWIYDAKDANGNNILTTADKATIRTAFMDWANQCMNADISGGDHPAPVGVVDDLQLVPGNQYQAYSGYRTAANNYYISHAENLMLMAMVMDPADDPPVDPSQPASQLGNSLRSYLTDYFGAWLYQEYSMFGDPATVVSDLGIPDNSSGAEFGLTSGGMPAEGFMYGMGSIANLASQMLAIQTAGFNNSDFASYTGPQIKMVNAPFWDRFVKGTLADITPTAYPPAPGQGNTTGDGLEFYRYASYGDMLRTYVTPDDFGVFQQISQLENEQGLTTHQNEALWFALDAIPGANLPNQVEHGITDITGWGGGSLGIEYMLLLDPSAAAPTDPRPAYPTFFYDPGLARILARSDWTPSETVFDYHANWMGINHMNANCGEFGLYRKGEWLTKEMTNYAGDAGGGYTSYFLNTLTLKNYVTDPLGYPPLFAPNQNFVGPEWPIGSQFEYVENGDPSTVVSNGGSGSNSYVYASTEMTDLYNAPEIWVAMDNAVAITRAQRNIFFINSDFIVTYDRATSADPGLFKRYNLSLVTNPSISGQTAVETMADGQKLYINTLLPENASITTSIAGIAQSNNPLTCPDGDFYCIQTAELEPTQYVMTVEDTSKPDDARFLHVLEGVDEGGTPLAVSSITSSSGTVFDGAVVGSTALMFIHDDTQTAGFASTGYSEPSSVTTNYVAGLKPNAGYTVSKSGGQVTITAGGTTVADNAGVLKF
ncbi:MAG: chitobiase/beta-hexosaminidase C-terminal domain-containing protein [Terracidiphilus sp.]